jgi:hypothetical protein
MLNSYNFFCRGEGGENPTLKNAVFPSLRKEILTEREKKKSKSEM